MRREEEKSTRSLIKGKSDFIYSDPMGGLVELITGFRVQPPTNTLEYWPSNSVFAESH